jgi:hypothetical protein
MRVARRRPRQRQGSPYDGAQNAAETLNGLLEEIVSRRPAPEASAQDAYRQLLRDHVRPALRYHGYRGSGWAA